MPLAISNILWPREIDDKALALAKAAGAEGIEVAPTRLAPWDELDAARLRDYKKHLHDRGLSIPSMQSLLYGKDDALLLGDLLAYRRFADHLACVADYAAELGATRLVFGAPKNRKRGDMPFDVALHLAVERLQPLAEMFHAKGMALAIEPVPADYGCDFLQTAAEVAELVRKIDHPGIRLHLDTGALLISKENAADIIAAHADILAHVHVSRPQLAAVFDVLPIDRTIAASLKKACYSGWLSIEIATQDNALAVITQSIAVVREAYAELF